MNNYEKGYLYQIILSSLTGFIDSAKVENYIRAGASYIRRELEARGIYLPGPSLEGIVLTSKTPNQDLEEATKIIASRLDPDTVQRICYGAIVAVYKEANNNSERVVPFEKLLEYYVYVKPVLDSLTMYHDYNAMMNIYNENIKHGHI